MTPRVSRPARPWRRSVRTTLVNVADREGDLYDLFVAALAATEGPAVHLLVRAQHGRRVAHP